MRQFHRVESCRWPISRWIFCIVKAWTLRFALKKMQMRERGVQSLLRKTLSLVPSRNRPIPEIHGGSND